MNNNVISFIRQDSCPICKCNECIECYDTNNKPINFTKILDYLEKDIFINLKLREFAYMKCKSCGKKFELNWCDRDIPIPLTNRHQLDYILRTYY